MMFFFILLNCGSICGFHDQKKKQKSFEDCKGKAKF